MPSSYRQTGRPPPLRYRTPSPPIDAFEPHTPTWELLTGSEAPPQWSATHTPPNTSKQPIYGQDNHVARHAHSPSSRDSMNALASIVLSTPSWPRPNKSHRRVTPPNQYPPAIEHTEERPSKRARSEKLPSPAWIRAPANSASRPATSYASIKDSRAMDAELLLNFSSNPVRFATTPTPAQAHLRFSENGHPEITIGEKGKASPNIGSPDRPPHASSSYAGNSSASQETVDPQRLPASNGPELGHSKSPKKITMAFPSELRPQDFRHQLIEASSSGRRPIGSSDPPALHQLRQNGSGPHHIGEHRILHGATAQQDSDSIHYGRERISEDGIVHPQLSAISSENAKQQCKLEPGAIHEHPILADSYWPSMLATTVESSMCASKIRPQKMIRKLEPRVSQPNSGVGVAHSLHAGTAKAVRAPEPAICAACNFTRNSISAETDAESTSWISCDGCKKWFHFACAGFKSEREVRAVDKYRCRGCKRIHGPTTYVRKSARAHTAIDYAGLNQGVIKTSDERPEHHYIKPIRDGTINIQPESFARMRPELVTAEHFEKGGGMKEPVVIPAEFNPRPGPAGVSERPANNFSDVLSRAASLEDWLACDPESRNAPDHGQDALDMVIPHDLTVRKVAELYGLEEKIEVIDVKSQNGEGKKWNMRRWADYYEHSSKKVVRNVISLEVSQSTLGRLIRRPQIVRDLDLQDSVWPAELQAKGEFPHVQFYCLMSVADCFTDFHIDFGGSSVFYHILKGRKTFFFIPPKEKHLKKYEEWCMSPAQNWTFLGDQTKECYRVDLSEGDTMLIPAGWIHAVWTPEDSLVIGGNFLTRLNYSMQLRIAQVEKTTGVARKFRYPHFQKVQWYTAIRYLESDPLPAEARAALELGGKFHRQAPAYHDFDAWGENSRNGRENYHARYYSQSELEGLPDLVRYLLRTALIDSGEITEGITADARNAVKKSIPRGYGDPLAIVKDFAIWCAWKRGNESIPHWAHADAVRESSVAESTARFSGGAALKRIQSEAALPAPRRHSSRNHVQQTLLPAKEAGITQEIKTPDDIIPSEKFTSSLLVGPQAPRHEPSTPDVVFSIDESNHLQSDAPTTGNHKRRKVASGSGAGSLRKTACETCRRRRRACKHKTGPTPQTPPTSYLTPTMESQKGATNLFTMTTEALSRVDPSPSTETQPNINPVPLPDPTTLVSDSATSMEPPQPVTGEHVDESTMSSIGSQKAAYRRPAGKDRKVANQGPSSTSQGRGRSKACNECRKSKRRCLHDEHGLEDPIKVRDAYPPSPTEKTSRKLEDQSPDAPVQSNADDDISLKQISHSSNSASPTSPMPPSRDEESAQPAVVGADILTEHTTADCGLLSDAIQEPHISLELLNGAETTPDERSSHVSRTMNKDLTPPSIRTQDAYELEANAERPIKSPNRDAMQQSFDVPFDALKHQVPQAQTETNSSFEQPAASSLVSPPASSHEDSDQPKQNGERKRKYSGCSSRHSPQHGQTQRFTPESGPTRRDSSSSSAVVNNTSTVEEKWSSTSPSASTAQALDAGQKQSTARIHSDTVADEESLKLIKALQAQDYGLRRRSRAA
ncbi:MAG: hypothetical protein Q9169_001428 [Polycauliona sp. 2 TL-2023]